MRSLSRPRRIAMVRASLRRSPVVALLGPRQCGKSTLARAIEYLNGVNSEIEAVIRAQWPSKAAPARAARTGSNA